MGFSSRKDQFLHLGYTSYFTEALDAGLWVGKLGKGSVDCLLGCAARSIRCNIDLRHEMESELGTGSYQPLSLVIVSVLFKVLDEQSGQLVSLLLPFTWISISITRVKDARIHTG